MAVLPSQVESFESGLMVAAIPLIEALAIVQPCNNSKLVAAHSDRSIRSAEQHCDS